MMLFRCRGLSMDPLIREGDEALVEEAASGEVLLGDILAYRRAGESAVIAHRLVRFVEEGGRRVLCLEGDFTREPERVFSDEIVGRVAGIRREGAVVNLEGALARTLKSLWKAFPFLGFCALFLLRWRSFCFKLNLLIGPKFYMKPPQEALSAIRRKFDEKNEIDFHRTYLENALEDWEEAAGRFFKPGGAVLDVGCGAGREAVVLARRGFRVTGVDIAPGMIEAARQRAAACGVEARFEAMSASEMDFPEDSFDFCLFSRNVYSFIPTRSLRVKMLGRIKKSMKRGGLIFLSAYTVPRALFSGQGLLDAFRQLRNFVLPGVFSSEPGDVWMRGVSPASRLETFCCCHFFDATADIAAELREAGWKPAPSGIEQVVMAEVPQ